MSLSATHQRSTSTCIIFSSTVRALADMSRSVEIPSQLDSTTIPSVSTLPPEVAINIFSQLPSFSDVFNLSSVCHSLRYIWLENVNPIYNLVAPRCIEGENAARRLLADQGGSSPDAAAVSARDVMQMMRNRGILMKAISQFEREVVSRVTSKYFSRYILLRCLERYQRSAGDCAPWTSMEPALTGILRR